MVIRFDSTDDASDFGGLGGLQERSFDSTEHVFFCALTRFVRRQEGNPDQKPQ